MKKYIATGAVVAVFVGGAAAAQTAPSLSVNVYTSPRAERGANDALMALVALSTEGSSAGVQIPSLPITASFGNGAAVSHFSDCRVRDVNALGIPLNNGGNAVGLLAGATTIPFDSPVTLAASTTRILGLTCDVAANAPLDGTVTLSLTPSAMNAQSIGMSGTTSVSVTPTVGMVRGSAGPLSGVVTIVAHAVPTMPTVPGVPNTGSSAAQNILLLTFAGLVALGGFAAARRLTSD